MFVQLERILTDGGYLDIARLTLYLPEAQLFDAAHGDLLPLDSARAGIGYTAASSSVHEFYPCVAARDAALYATFQERAPTCAPPDLSLCALRLSSDRVVNVAFPLGAGFFDNMMDIYDQWDVLPLNLYLDFVLRVRDSQDRATFARFYTSTQVKRETMLEYCTTRALEVSLDSLFDFRILHGLGTTASRTLEPTAYNFSATTSASNFDTIVLEGNASFFERPEHEHHGVDLEAALTLFFLSSVKKRFVLNLFESGEALIYDEISQRQVPSPALLEVCPLQRTSRTQGCIAHFHVRDRVLDAIHHSAFGIVPRQTSFANETLADNAARDWLAARPWARHTEFELARMSEHVQTVGEAYRVNGRFSRAIVLASDVPTIDSDGAGENSTQHVQFYLRILTARIDLRTGTRADGQAIVLRVRAPAVQAPLWAFQVHQAAHDALATAFADVLGLRIPEVRVLPENATNTSMVLEIALPWRGDAEARSSAERIARALRAFFRSTQTRRRRARRAEPRRGLDLGLFEQVAWEVWLGDTGKEIRASRRLLQAFPSLHMTKVFAMPNKNQNRRFNGHARKLLDATNTVQNFSSISIVTELRGVQNGDELMRLLEDGNQSTAVLKRARVAAVRVEPEGINACTMTEDELRAAVRADLGPAFVGASRGTIADVVVASVVILNRADLACDGNSARRRLRQISARVSPVLDTEIVLLPTPAVVADDSVQIFVEATPELLSKGVQKFVAEPTQRTNATLVFVGQGISSDGDLFAVTTTPGPTTPALPTPTPTPVPGASAQQVLAARVLLTTTLLSALLVFGGVGRRWCSPCARGGRRGCLGISAFYAMLLI